MIFLTPAPPANAAVKVAVPFPRFVIPGPENVPEGAWLPVRVIAGALLHMLTGRPVKLTVGNEVTVTDCKEVLLQPVTISVYE